MSPRSFLINGLIAGFLAGTFAFGVAHQVGEPYVKQSIALEEGRVQHDHGSEQADEEPAVSRQEQSTLGLLTGTLAIGTAHGGIAGLASAFAVGRLGRLRPAGTTAVVAAVGFASFALSASAKYTPNPPGVGHPETLTSRTAVFFTFQIISVGLAVGAMFLASKLSRRRDGWTSTVIPVVGWLVLITVAGLLLPTVNEVPKDFPANTLWGFRLSGIAIQATLWGIIGVVLSGLVAHNYRSQESRHAVAASIR